MRTDVQGNQRLEARLETGTRQVPLFEKISRIVAVGSVIVGLGAGAWIWQHRLPNSPPRSLRSRMERSYMVPPTMMLGGTMGGGGQSGSGNMPIAGRFPRYVANLTTHVGEYMVSIRQIRTQEDGQDLYYNIIPGLERQSLDRSILALQVMCANPAAIERVQAINTHLSAIEDTGKRLEVTSVGETADFENGKAQLAFLAAPSSKARYLKQVTGELVLSNGGKTEKKPFVIENVPLPVMNHLFGVATTGIVRLSEEKRKSLHGDKSTHVGNSVLTGLTVHELRSAFPPFQPEPGEFRLQNRLILQSGTINHFRVPLPALLKDTNQAVPSENPELECWLTPQITEYGKITLDCKVIVVGESLPVFQEKMILWEDEPIILLLPRTGKLKLNSTEEQVAIWLNLFVDEHTGLKEATIAVRSPFPVRTHEAGGAIIGQIMAGKQPFGYAVANMAIRRIQADQNEKVSTEVLETVLNTDGKWGFANLSPGRYQIYLKDSLKPYRNKILDSTSWQDYVRTRYGVKNPDWLSPPDQTIVVRPGAVTYLKPWTLGEKKSQ